jgi:hypothetical protein
MAKSSWLRGMSRGLRGAGAFTALVGGWLDFRAHRNAGDSFGVSLGKATVETGGALGGAYLGAELAGGACLASVAAAPFAWLCAGAGAVTGAVTGHFLAGEAGEELFSDPNRCRGYSDPQWGGCVATTDLD